MEVSIRRLNMEDAPVMAVLLNNYNVWRNLSDVISYPYTAAHAEEFISRVLTCESFSGNFATQANDQFCGLAGWSPGIFNKRLTAKVGYWYGEPFWGKGIATRALELLVEKAFSETGFVRLESSVFARNEASRRVLLKCGFTQEASLKDGFVKEGEILDGYLFGLTRKDYMNRKNSNN